MKKLFALISLVILMAFGNPSEDVISWDPEYRLSWEDFQGSVDPLRPEGVESVTQVIIDLRSRMENQEVNFTVICLFEKNRSWTANTHSAYLLNHEQLHFDIAEVYARKLRKALAEIKGLNHQNFEPRVRDVYRKVLNEHNDIQDRYDRETWHSQNKEKQAEWNEKVSLMLEQTLDYAGPEIILSLKGR